MKKILNSIEHIFLKSLWAIGLASLIFATALPPFSYAATSVDRGNEKVIQPFELTNPAATRSEAYDEIAKLNKDPKALIEAENKEEQAEEKVYKQAQKAIDTAGK
jgi:hypothetical protein